MLDHEVMIECKINHASALDITILNINWSNSISDSLQLIHYEQH